MSAKLLATQVAAVCTSMLGLSLMMEAANKSLESRPNRRFVIFDKLHRIRGEMLENGIQVLNQIDGRKMKNSLSFV